MNKPKSIMLIDDNKIDLFVSQKIIERLEMKINTRTFISATSAINYLKIIKKHMNTHTMLIPDIILLDINMPDMNGFQFLTEFEKLDHLKNEKIEIHMLSSSSNFQDIQRAKNEKLCMSILNKPLTTENLKKTFIGFNPYLDVFDYQAEDVNLKIIKSNPS